VKIRAIRGQKKLALTRATCGQKKFVKIRVIRGQKNRCCPLKKESGSPSGWPLSAAQETAPSLFPEVRGACF
jgi:hypothetical protein